MAISKEQMTEYVIAVNHPGKFEGEPIYVPYFWDLVLNGSQDGTIYDEDSPVDYVQVNVEDAEMFQELRGRSGLYILLWESNQGFVYHRFVNSKQLVDLQEGE